MNEIIKGLLRQELKSPIVWTSLAASLIVWPLTLELTPLASSLSSNNARDLAYDVAYLAALSGAVFAGWRLTSLEWIIGRSGSSMRAATWLACVSLAAFIPATMSLGPWIAFSGASSLSGLFSMLLVCVHLAALSLLLSSTGFSKRERSIALVLFAVGLQGALRGESGPLLLASRVLDPTAAAAYHDVNLPLFSVQVASICGLILLSSNLRSWQRNT